MIVLHPRFLSRAALRRRLRRSREELLVRTLPRGREELLARGRSFCRRVSYTSRLLACFGAGVLQEGVSVFTVPGVVGGRLPLLVPSSMPVLGLAATLATEDASCLRRIAASGAFCAACTTGLVYVLISPAM